jgi:hypothetical protein
MNNPIEGVIAALLAVLALLIAFTVGAWFFGNKIVHHCQNYGKFTAEGKVYECKEVGVVK